MELPVRASPRGIAGHTREAVAPRVVAEDPLDRFSALRIPVFLTREAALRHECEVAPARRPVCGHQRHISGRSARLAVESPPSRSVLFSEGGDEASAPALLPVVEVGLARTRVFVLAVC